MFDVQIVSVFSSCRHLSELCECVLKDQAAVVLYFFFLCQQIPWKHQNQHTVSLRLSAVWLPVCGSLGSGPTGSDWRCESLKTALRYLVSFFKKAR